MELAGQEGGNAGKTKGSPEWLNMERRPQAEWLTSLSHNTATSLKKGDEGILGREGTANERISERQGWERSERWEGRKKLEGRHF